VLLKLWKSFYFAQIYDKSKLFYTTVKHCCQRQVTSKSVVEMNPFLSRIAI